MKVDTLADFLEALRNSNVLTPPQLELVETLAKQIADPRQLAKELVARQLLTPFQAKMIWNGRGDELVLGSYLLLDPIGEGGMGIVYKAKHRRMERIVALKVIRKQRLSNPEAVRRFRREILAVAQLSHPNVVMAFDADQAGDVHFFAMEYVDGIDLTRWVRERGVLPVRQACDYIRQAALGLQHAFEQGMVHRDIKPSNLLVVLPRGSATDSSRTISAGPNGFGLVKLLDLGLARVGEDGAGKEPSHLTQEGLVVGTPDFLAPEQAKNASKVDIRADLYALGCTLYYLLSGQVPFPGGTPTEKMIRHYTEPPTPITQLRPDVPPGVAAILDKLMAKRPEDRYQTPIELADALEPYCRQEYLWPGQTQQPGFPQQPYPQPAMPQPAYPPSPSHQPPYSTPGMPQPPYPPPIPPQMTPTNFGVPGAYPPPPVYPAAAPATMLPPPMPVSDSTMFQVDPGTEVVTRRAQEVREASRGCLLIGLISGGFLIVLLIVSIFLVLNKSK
jgi:serine/threonine protein kinase